MPHPTCFLFLDSLEPLQFASLRLDENNEADSSLAYRSTEEICELANQAKTIVILPTHLGNILELELPWINANKVRQALPFALEEQIVSSIEELHFAFDKAHYQNDKYLIVALPKTVLDKIINYLKSAQIHVDGISLDFFALENNEIIDLQDYLIANTAEFKGALKEPFAAKYLEANKEIKATKIHDAAHLAKKIQSNNYINLLQGDYKKKNGSSLLRNLSIAALVLWLVTLGLSSSIMLYKLNQNIAKYDGIIKTKYLELFPGTKTMVAPMVRIRQALNPNSKLKTSNFWHLLHITLLAMPDKTLQIKQIQFQENVMTINLNCPSFAILGNYVQQLQKRQIQVKQTQAKLHQNEVLATLELK